MKKLHVLIPLLQAIKDVPIYAKIVKELCGKCPDGKPRYPPIMHVIGKVFELILGNDVPTKYEDLWNSSVTIHIGGKTFLIL